MLRAFDSELQNGELENSELSGSANGDVMDGNEGEGE
jgi:hypothetical protein